MSHDGAPTATYRVQLHGKWGFAAARSVVAYLKLLGIDWLYTSPILKARRGSTHGYDVVDPRQISDELGGDEQFSHLVARLHAHDMGLLLDIVPNHMAIGGDNPAWMDVLTHGRLSRYAGWFDIVWPKEGGRGSILLPVLGRPLEEAVEAGDVRIEIENGAIVCRYFENLFPIEPGSWRRILSRAAKAAHDASDHEAQERLEQLAAVEVPDWRDATDEARDLRCTRTELLQTQLQALLKSHPPVKSWLNVALRETPLHEVLEEQPYELRHWREAMKRVSYRRFFDIVHLIGVRVEMPDVLEATHKRMFELVQDGSVNGVRIDHIDGLADPARYLHQLRQACRERCQYVVVEKVLAGDERLDEGWPVVGTTGYDFVNVVNGVFVDAQGLAALATHLESISGSQPDFESLMHEQKRRVAKELFGGEVTALVEQVMRIAMKAGEDAPTNEDVRFAIIEISARLPVYRTYITRDHVRNIELVKRDLALIESASAAARQDAGTTEAAIELVRRILTLDVVRSAAHVAEAVADFVVKWQQFTGPLAAKGVEDTAMYREARLVSVNEVGADATHLEHPAGIDGFHRHNERIAERWPHTMTCSSTHDTKRSEDVRARLHVLSEMAEEWIATFTGWRDMNAPLRRTVHKNQVPDAVTESFLYQNTIGAWPVVEFDEAEFAERIASYAVKAAREAKMQTSWIDSDGDYEAALVSFVKDLLTSEAGRGWRTDVQRLLTRIVFPGAMNALSAVLLKIASPGVPDFYQGTELWDFSLVDPDNRRPVDYEKRRRILDEIVGMPEAPDDRALTALLRTWRDGQIKMFITHRCLRLRLSMRDCFLGGRYIPLQPIGPRDDRICAFARNSGSEWVVAIAAARVLDMIESDGEWPDESAWGNTSVELPADAPNHYRDAFTGREVLAVDARIPVAAVLRHLPVALLYA